MELVWSGVQRISWRRGSRVGTGNRKKVCMLFCQIHGTSRSKGLERVGKDLESWKVHYMGEPFFFGDIYIYIYNIAVDLPLSHRA